MPTPPPVNLLKRAAWSRLYDFDFSEYGEFAQDVPPATIQTATIAWTPVDATLTLGVAVIGQTAVQQQIAGGTAGTVYSGTCTITLSNGSDTATLTRDGQITVV